MTPPRSQQRALMSSHPRKSAKLTSLRLALSRNSSEARAPSRTIQATFLWLRKFTKLQFLILDFAIWIVMSATFWSKKSRTNSTEKSHTSLFQSTMACPSQTLLKSAPTTWPGSPTNKPSKPSPKKL